MTIKKCTGCGRLNTEPLGVNKNGEPFLACCPDNNYVPLSYREQAIHLINEFAFAASQFVEPSSGKSDIEIGKPLALIAVNKILEATKIKVDRPEFCGEVYSSDWLQIKSEIEKLDL